MFDPSRMPEVSESMKRLVKEVRKHAIAPKTKTFFSIEGIIGHYENPTSELLAFFLSPNEEHGLGSLFLRAFFTCLGKDSCGLNLTDAEGCQREIRTHGSSRIDLLVSGFNWVLVIENKINHWLANPLGSYEQHAKQYYSGKKQYFAILSPAGKPEPKWPNWKPVSYQNYCNALKVEFAKAGFPHLDSKWQVFARELILHLENELYDPAMTLTTEQRNFVESNLENISHLKQLFDCYTAELRKELTARLQQEIPSRPFRFYDRAWDIACDENFAGVVAKFCFYTPFHKDGNPKRKYKIIAWVKCLSESQRERAADLLVGARPEGAGDWVRESFFDSYDEAVTGLANLAKEFVDLWVVDSIATAAPPTLSDDLVPGNNCPQ